MSHHEEAGAHIDADPATIRTILLDPLALPRWNPAFLKVGGPGNAVTGEAHPIVVRPGLVGSFNYLRIEPMTIDLEWSVPGLHETARWSLIDAGTGTLVTHQFWHSGPLARVMRNSFRGVSTLRLARLAEQITNKERTS
ncbi:MAG: SRPBCC family protein [Homoserinimonas sp.]